MNFTIKKSRTGTMTSTRGHSRAFINRSFRIILLNTSKEPIATIKKLNTLKLAEEELENINSQFINR